jgi:hypothetical protein
MTRADAANAARRQSGEAKQSGALRPAFEEQEKPDTSGHQ